LDSIPLILVQMLCFGLDLTLVTTPEYCNQFRILLVPMLCLGIDSTLVTTPEHCNQDSLTEFQCSALERTFLTLSPSSNACVGTDSTPVTTPEHCNQFRILLIPMLCVGTDSTLVTTRSNVTSSGSYSFQCSALERTFLTLSHLVPMLCVGTDVTLVTTPEQCNQLRILLVPMLCVGTDVTLVTTRSNVTSSGSYSSQCSALERTFLTLSPRPNALRWNGPYSLNENLTEV
jgi:hypothetical protein